MLTTGDNELVRPPASGGMPARVSRGEEFRWRFRASTATQRLPELGWARARRVPQAAVRTRVLSWAVAIGVASWLLTRLRWSSVLDSDPALHLRLIRDIARSHRLPTELPNLAARVSEGGNIEAMFPYSYTPLYHLVGGLLYGIAGYRAVLSINVIAAAVIAFFIARFVGRRYPWFVAILASSGAWLSPHVQVPFQEMFMEPMMLGFLFPAVWLCYMAMMTRRRSPAALAGILLGLSVSTRQVAVFYVFVLGIVCLLYLFERRAWRHLSREAGWIVALSAALALTAAPSLLYLAQVTGSIGYADLTIPGASPHVPLDVAANQYIASITKPDLSITAWLDRFQRTLLYGDKWLPLWLAVMPLGLFAVGVTALHSKGGASRFFARWILVQFMAELAVFVTIHGNSRYVILSQMLFFTVVPVGGYVAVCALLRFARNGGVLRRVSSCAALGVLIAGSVISLTPPGYIRYYRYSESGELQAFRAREYANMGAWVNANTPPDSIILTPRTYTAELTWERTVTWVTFYGNRWVVDAISTPDPAIANRLLASHGIDYVLVPDPPGTYIDRIPRDGMRQYLTIDYDDPRYFTLEYATYDPEGSEQKGRVVYNGLRLYRVEAPTVSR